MFLAPTNLETATSILNCIKGKIPFIPLSTKTPVPPQIDLPKNGFLLATSGSTGAPKLAHLSLENLDYMASFPHPDLQLVPNDNYMLSVPLYHISGLSILYRCYKSGAKIIYPNTGQDHLVTHVSFVPTQLRRFLQNPSVYPKLKAILLGGSKIPLELCLHAYRMGIPIYITYGMTETTSQITTKIFNPMTGITFGHPLPHREIKIVDGEIYVRGKTLFHGYLKLQDPFIDGWFPTKDLGKIGANGLELHGRKDRMFISGGENIHPEEIELALLSHPQITHAKAESRDDLEYGQRPVVKVLSPLSATDVLNHLLERLPKFKVPNKTDILVAKEESEFFSPHSLKSQHE